MNHPRIFMVFMENHTSFHNRFIDCRGALLHSFRILSKLKHVFVIVGNLRGDLGEFRGSSMAILEIISDGCLPILLTFVWSIRDPSGSGFAPRCMNFKT